MKTLRQILIGFGITGYLFFAMFGLLAMGHMHHGSMSVTDKCPFMVGEQVLCTMDFAEHITTWQALINTTNVVFVIFFISILFIFFYFYLRPPNLARSKLYIKPLRESHIIALFSQGILNPKAP